MADEEEDIAHNEKPAAAEEVGIRTAYHEGCVESVRRKSSTEKVKNTDGVADCVQRREPDSCCGISELRRYGCGNHCDGGNDPERDLSLLSGTKFKGTW